ncbi:MAG: DUF2905 domain-containing protein [Acidimicrobiia bacterium]
METLGRLILGLGFVLLIIGGVFVLLGRFGVPSLPGDISFKRGGTQFFFPIGTSILISIILTVILNLVLRR